MNKRLLSALLVLIAIAVTACEQTSPTAPSAVTGVTNSAGRPGAEISNGTRSASGSSYGTLHDDDREGDDREGDDHEGDDRNGRPRAKVEVEPEVIQRGQSAELEWKTRDATRVVLNGKQVAAEGEQRVSPTATTTYTLVATNAAGTTTVTATLTVTDSTPPPPAVMPKATLTATPATIESGQSATLRWTSADATSVTLNGTSVAASGTQTVSPATTTTYTLAATNAAGTTTATATVTVTASPPAAPAPPMPPAAITATPPASQRGQSSRVGRSSAGAPTGPLNGASVATSGSQTVSPTTTTTYTLAATNAAGTRTATATVTVTAPPAMPRATLTATPNTIQSGQAARLDWTTADAMTVTLNGATVPASGSQMVSPAATTTYTLAAGNETGTATASATVTVIAPPPPPMRITYGNDIRPILQQNCVQCHSGPDPSGGRDFTTYAGVRGVADPGDPNSLIIKRTRPGGSMHGFLSPDPVGRAETIRRWVVEFAAAEQ